MARCLRLFIVAAGSIALSGCAQFGTTGIDRAEPLGIQGTGADILPALPPLPPPPVSLGGGPSAFDKTVRDQYVELWMARSDGMCREYKDRLIRASRDVRFATDASRTVLSGLATIFTSLSVIHPLTGAATIIGGVGGAADDDVFHKQGGELIASAIQTARESQANQIEFNLRSSPADYSIWRAHRDVVNYHNMCSLETALAQVRSSLKATSPDGGNTPPAAQGTQRPSALPTEMQMPGSLPLGQSTTAPPPAASPSPRFTYTPPKPTGKVTEKIGRTTPVGSPDLLKVFAEPGWVEKDLVTVQTAFCIPKNQRGRVNPATIANVNLIVTGTEATPVTDAARIGRRPGPGNYADIVRAAGGAGVECDTAGYRNFYENSKYRAAQAEETALLKDMQEFLSPGATTPPPTTLKDGRSLVKRMRAVCGLATAGLFADQVTPDLTRAFAANKCGSPAAAPQTPALLTPAPLTPAR